MRPSNDFNILLITGAIDISSFDIPYTSVVDIEKRKSQYLYSIEYAIENYSEINHIVFCENTNYCYDYSRIYQKAKSYNKVLEVLTFLGDYNAIQRHGKGYGEGEIIKYALENSVLMKNADIFFKLTGRLVVTNFDSVVKKTKERSAFVYYPSIKYSVDHISTIFYKVDKNIYLRELNDVFMHVNDNDDKYLERLFFLKLRNCDIVSFSRLPKISGQSGSSGLTYDLSGSEYFIESILNYLGIHNIKKNLFQRVIFDAFGFAISKYKEIIYKFKRKH